VVFRARSRPPRTLPRSAPSWSRSTATRSRRRSWPPRGLVDDIIDPADTRRKDRHVLEILVNKRELRPAKKHGLGPV
jgi:acetyl-CoA carboxylase carboxyltransferase component